MLNVLHSIDTSGPGGAETVLLNTVTGLESSRFRSIVALSGKGWLYRTLKKSGIEPIVLDAKGSWKVSYLAKLVRVILHNKVDVIHSHLFGSNVYCSLAGMLTGVRVISTFHGFVDATAGSSNARFKFWIINRGSERVVFVSRQLKDAFIKNGGIDPKRAVVIHNGIDTEKFRPGRSNRFRTEFSLGEEAKIIGSVGNIRPSKNYDLLLRTASIIRKRTCDVKFVVVGEGAGALYDSLLEKRKALGLDGTVFFAGFRRNEPELYHNFDIFLLPSSSEGFSISTLEAMASGVPVVVTRSGGPEEIVENGRNGVLVETDDEGGVSAAIMRLLVNAQLCARLSDEGRKVAVDRFQLSKTTRSYERCYEGCGVRSAARS